MTDVIVLGAGIVGVSVAIHLQKRGRSVLLIDRREPGRETSFGNSGVIQAEGIRPHEFPRDLATIWRTGLNRSIDARYHLRGLHRFVAPLARYWWHSEPARYDAMVRDYAPLIHNAVPEHAQLVGEAGADALIRKNGWLFVYRSEAARDAMFTEADRLYAPYDVGYQKLDSVALSAMEPHLKIKSVGALRWTEPWTVTDPGALVAAYARLFQSLGGTIKTAEALPLQQSGNGWTAGGESAAEIVVALGPWADTAIRPLGYRLPLFVKRGYHMHYAMQPGTKLNNWLIDAEGAYLLAPMDRGVRLTTGAEFAPQHAPQTPAQLDGAERIARDFIPLGERLDPQPWMGARPCTPDMKPVIGPAPRHKGLWFAFGHAHHGLTLGPVTGRLLAEQMTGETPFLNLAPFGAERFLR